MEEAYLKASAGGTVPANARQIYYVARPLVQALLGPEDQARRTTYFTQDLLPDFMRRASRADRRTGTSSTTRAAT